MWTEASDPDVSIERTSAQVPRRKEGTMGSRGTYRERGTHFASSFASASERTGGRKVTSVRESSIRSRVRKALWSLAAVGAAASIAGLGTYASFTGTTSASQATTAGTITVALGA